MSQELEGEDSLEQGTPIWAAFGDLMSVLLGVFVLVLVGVIGVQLHLETQLREEVQQRKLAEQRRKSLQQALATPIAEGRITLVDGRIGIRGSVLFANNSDQLQPEGRQVLASLAGPLRDYLRARSEILMVSGFTDDQPVHADNRRFADNLELSAQRALTVTRALVAAGVPPQAVFSAAFGAQQPLVANTDAASRARNRRVEIAPMPRPRPATGAAGG